MRPVSFALLTAVSALSLLTGCQPKDPLDWKVSADSPADLQEWRERVATKLPPELQQEINLALNNVAAVLPGQGAYHGFNETNNPLCLQINRHSVRALIQAGYFAAATHFQQKISLTTDSLTRNLNTANEAELDATARHRYETVIDFQRQQLDSYRRALAEISEKSSRYAIKTP